MRRLLIYTVFLVIAVVITVATTVLQSRPYPTQQIPDADFLYVSGYPLHYLITGFAGFEEKLQFPNPNFAWKTEILWGHLAIDILFWFLIIVMLAKAWDLVKQSEKKS
ncbi:MAG: hypothetical protein WD231_00480 [Candidatus Woykebacteria bacterium]